VRQQYPNALQDYRARSAKAQTALVVIIDADTGDTGRRLRQFKDALEQAQLAARSNDEAIIHLIPRRNEETDYKGQDVEGLIKDAAETFFAWSRPNTQVPSGCIPSLLFGIDEAKRLA
jgi:hypothetical protein